MSLVKDSNDRKSNFIADSQKLEREIKDLESEQTRLNTLVEDTRHTMNITIYKSEKSKLDTVENNLYIFSSILHL